MSTQRASATPVRTSDPTMERVTSRDGTEIAYWSSGSGPPLLLVHGTAGTHERFAPLLPYLEPHATVHVMDRRGRGASGDSSVYELAREFEDVAAVVDSIAETSRSVVDVYGHSYGGNCAFGAALLTSNIRRLVLYEGWPPLRPERLEFPPEVGERLDRLVAEGDRELALETFMREIVGVPEDDLATVRAQPTWQARVGAVHTITREIEGFYGHPLDPEEGSKITVPVLVVTGSETPPSIRDDPEGLAEALPDARIAVIDGQQHIADILAPKVFAATVLAFLLDPDRRS